MKFIYTGILILGFIAHCVGQHDEQFISKHSDIHRVIVEEVLQTSSYTYLLVKDKGQLQWLAVPKIDAKIGETYLFKGGNEMKDFKSTQLNRIFESVIFLGDIVNANSMGEDKPETFAEREKPENSGKRIDVLMDKAEGGISIAELFSDKETFEGKIVKIKGKVVQFSPSIMDRNWIHLQDGTDFEGNFDLVATSNSQADVGDIVVLEGKITLNKDFGYGYFYNVIMEECTVVKK